MSPEGQFEPVRLASIIFAKPWVISGSQKIKAKQNSFSDKVGQGLGEYQSIYLGI